MDVIEKTEETPVIENQTLKETRKPKKADSRGAIYVDFIKQSGGNAFLDGGNICVRGVPTRVDGVLKTVGAEFDIALSASDDFIKLTLSQSGYTALDVLEAALAKI